MSLSTDGYEAIILTCLTARALDPLKMVRSVASQIRATPRAPNQKARPSDFIKSITQPLTTMMASQPGLKSYEKTWAERIATEVFTNYASTLIGVRKTEDLLKRHRKIKKTGFSLFGGGAQESAGDDGAFDAQMTTDVEALSLAFEGTGVDVKGMEEYGKLEEAMVMPLDE